ncbi:TonB family protein [Cupriavidus sp. SIMBA_020]|uniref:TonB family protein n=1 Tax=Cupriavidus sp. SIMBA_020 TaxID=3085766 RepID=UPI0039795DFF
MKAVSKANVSTCHLSDNTIAMRLQTLKLAILLGLPTVTPLGWAAEIIPAEPNWVGKYCSELSPIYPSRARASGMDGAVLFAVESDGQGHAKVIQVIQSSGYRVLDEAGSRAVEAVTCPADGVVRSSTQKIVFQLH